MKVTISTLVLVVAIAFIGIIVIYPSVKPLYQLQRSKPSKTDIVGKWCLLKGPGRSSMKNGSAGDLNNTQFILLSEDNNCHFKSYTDFTFKEHRQILEKKGTWKIEKNVYPSLINQLLKRESYVLGIELHLSKNATQKLRYYFVKVDNKIKLLDLNIPGRSLLYSRCPT
jgi:hypothetical protein